MSDTLRGLFLLIGAGLLALIVALIYALWLLGSYWVRLLALLAVGGGLVIGLLWGLQFPLRAWRSNQQPERHFYHERVREIHHGGGGVTVAAPPVYPELMRAAFLAGMYRGQLGSGEIGAGDEHPNEYGNNSREQ